MGHYSDFFEADAAREYQKEIERIEKQFAELSETWSTSEKEFVIKVMRQKADFEGFFNLIRIFGK
jgi:hypothetical protein